MERTVERCVASVLSQFKQGEMELILINDGSTDRTGELLAPYRDMEDVTVIDQENRGLSGARNRGMDCAGGRYLFFLDSDDFLLPDTLVPLLYAAVSADADIVEAKIHYLLEGQDAPISEEAGMVECREVSPFVLSGYAWGKMLRRSLFEELQFPEGYWFEDSVMSWLVYPQAKKVLYFPGRVVCYCQNLQGITAASEGGNPKSIDTWWITEQMHRDFLTLERPMSNEFYDMILRQIALNSARMKALVDEARVAVFNLTTSWHKQNFSDQSTSLALLAIVEKALRLERFDLYERACEVARGNG